MKNKYDIFFLFLFSLLSCAIGMDKKDLMGKDSDSDGVRDDIQKWVNEEASWDDINYKKALYQYAKYLRKSFLYVNDKEGAIRNNYLKNRARDCISLVQNTRKEEINVNIQYRKYQKMQKEIFEKIGKDLDKAKIQKKK